LVNSAWRLQTACRDASEASGMEAMRSRIESNGGFEADIATCGNTKGVF
jgi:hypothetical protein